MESEWIFKKRLTEIEKRIDFVNVELAKCVEGRLYQVTRGSKRFIRAYYVDGKRCRQGITNKPDMIVSLLRRSLLEKELIALTDEAQRVRECLDRLPRFDMGSEFNALKLRYPNLPGGLLEDAMQLRTASEWETAPYKMSDYMPEMKRHTTSRGLKVRSKSELLIAEMLYSHGVSFRYEQVIRIEDSTLVPDFTIRRSDGKIYIWEHEGLMRDTEYAARQYEKARLYAFAGFVPWDNMIVTYDDREGLIDLRVIESEILNKLIV